MHTWLRKSITVGVVGMKSPIMKHSPIHSLFNPYYDRWDIDVIIVWFWWDWPIWHRVSYTCFHFIRWGIFGWRAYSFALRSVLEEHTSLPLDQFSLRNPTSNDLCMENISSPTNLSKAAVCCFSYLWWQSNHATCLLSLDALKNLDINHTLYPPNTEMTDFSEWFIIFVQNLVPSNNETITQDYFFTLGKMGRPNQSSSSETESKVIYEGHEINVLSEP